jgi:arylsulfatase A-like enzyme/Flp pilus assembly protein TadD
MARRTSRPAHGPRRLALVCAAATLVTVAWLLRWSWLATSPAMIPRGDYDVLLVTIDTLRADAPGFAGGRARTPNLDRLAASGVRFAFAHAHSVVTLPSHASILTGLYPFDHGVRDNSGYRLGSQPTTLATRLARQGYETGAFVGAFPLDARFGLGTGFDVYDDRYPAGGRAGELSFPERPAPAVVAAALRWIGPRRGRFFAWLHLYDPHAPYRPPAPFDREYADDPYAGEVAAVDAALGPLFEAVAHRRRPVLVVVTADHGESLGSHGEATHGLFAYEDTLRVPLVVATLPASGRSPIVSQASARHVDIVPTVLDALRLPLARELPGRSLLTVAAGGADSVSSYFEALTASLNRGWAPLTGVIVGRHKYVHLPMPELYDLDADPHERTNLAGSQRSQADVLEHLLAGMASPAAPRLAESEDTRRQLASLGYVAGTAGRGGWSEGDDPKTLIGLDQALQRGVEEYQRGSAETARATFLDVVRQRPSMSTPYLHLASMAWEGGRPEEAIRILRQALAAGARTSEVEAQLGIYLAEGGQPEEAVEVLREVTRTDANDLDAWNGLGIALARAGRGAEAVALLTRLAAEHPTDATTLGNLGTAQLGEGRLEEARRAFVGALEADATLAIALNGLGVIDVRLGRREAAIDWWRRAVAADARQFDALYNLGVALRKAGDPAEARRCLQQFVASAPPSAYAEEIRRFRLWLADM